MPLFFVLIMYSLNLSSVMCDFYIFKIISPTKNTSYEIKSNINNFLLEDEKYLIKEYEENNLLQADLCLKLHVANYENKRKLLNNIYPNIEFMLYKYAYVQDLQSFDELYFYNYILFKIYNTKNNIKLLFKNIDDILHLSIKKEFLNNEANDYYILFAVNSFDLNCEKKLDINELIQKEGLYREKLFCAYNNIYNYNIYFGKNAINYLEKVTPKIPKDNLSELKVDKYIKDFGINHNLIKQINIAEKKIPVAYVRALRDYIIKNYDFKNCLNSFLEDIIDNFKNVSYEDLQVSLNVFHEILCCNQLLSDEWHKIFLTSPKRKYYAFNQPYIKKRLQEKLKIPVKSVVFSDVDSYKIEPYKKNLIILLKKPGNLHQAPLIRIVNNNKIYWILMETIAESYKWFAPINYEIFYELLRKLVKYDQEKNPTKEVKGYLNRVKLQNSKYLCEVFAYANSLSIFENLEEFIAFLDSYQPQARKDYKLELTYLENTNNLFPEYEDIIELTYLPNFIAKFCQSISSEESKKALSSMILLDNDSTKSKKINATILLYSCELLKNVINEIYLTFSNDYQTDCMLYYKKSNLEYK